MKSMDSKHIHNPPLKSTGKEDVGVWRAAARPSAHLRRTPRLYHGGAAAAGRGGGRGSGEREVPCWGVLAAISTEEQDPD
jgi:hypothetical protein